MNLKVLSKTRKYKELDKNVEYYLFEFESVKNYISEE